MADIPSSRAEVEIALRDNVSPGLRNVARDIRALNRTIKAMGDDGQAGMERVSRSTTGLSGVTRTAVRDLTIMGNYMSGFTKGLVGSLGTAAALDTVTKAVNNLALSRVQLSMFSQDTKFAASDIHTMRAAMARMGLEANQADQYIGGMATKLQELGATKQSSELFQKLSEMGPRGTELAYKLLGNKGDHKKSFDDILEVYKRQGPEAKFYLSQILGIPQSVLENMDDYRKKVRNTFLDNEQAMKKYMDNLSNLKEYGSSQWSRFASHVVDELNKVVSGLDEVGESNALSDFANREFDAVIKGVKDAKQELQDIYDFFSKTLPGAAASLDDNVFGALGIDKDTWGKKKDGTDLKSRLDEAFEGLQKESNRTLLDVRDILKRMEDRANTGKERGDLSNYGKGIRSEGGNAKASLGGFRPNRSDEGPAEALPIGPSRADTEGAKYLAARREPFRKELSENPRTRELLGAIVSAENPGAGPAVAESLMNRTELVNRDRAKRGLPPLTLEDMIKGTPSIGGGKSFYGPVRTGAVNSHLQRMRTDKAYAARMYAQIDKALDGSNTIRGHTDQGSAGDPNYERGGVGVNINKERFNHWAYRGAKEYQKELDAEYNRRNNIDKSNYSGSVWEKGSGADISVKFEGVPKGVQTEASTRGNVFKELRVQREPQAPKAGSPPDFQSRFYFQ